MSIMNHPGVTYGNSQKSSTFNIDLNDIELDVQKNEIATLIKTRQELLSGEIFAVIIEPMQCEGGDQYGTDRFYAGLLSSKSI